MYLVRNGRLWVSDIVILSDEKYEVTFTTNKKYAKELDSNEVNVILIDFNKAKVFRKEIKELSEMEIMYL